MLPLKSSQNELGKESWQELKKKNEKSSDYDDFYVATLDEAHEQINTAEYVLSQVEMYLSGKGVID